MSTFGTVALRLACGLAVSWACIAAQGTLGIAAADDVPGTPFLHGPEWYRQVYHLPLADEGITARVHSYTQRSENLEVRIIALSQAPRDQVPLIPNVFYWPKAQAFRPEAERTGKTAAFAEYQADEDLAQWLPKVLALREGKEERLRLFKENESVSYYAPAGRAVLARLVRAPFIKGLWRPAQVQVLMEATFSDENLRKLLEALPAWDNGSIPESKLPLFAEAFKDSPFAADLRNAKWQLRSFGWDRDYRLVTVTLSLQNDPCPLRLQAAIGPRGCLMVLSGDGFESVVMGGNLDLGKHPRGPGEPEPGTARPTVPGGP